MKQGYLILANGRVFEGKRFGKCDEDVIGELVFTTAMTGYLETLTDPSYYGQIVVQTFPLIGNVGVISEDFENPRPGMTAYVVRDLCDAPSNFRCEGALEPFMETHGIPGFCCEDTRSLTRIIREHGVINAIITDAPELTAEQSAALAAYSVKDAVPSVTGGEIVSYSKGDRRVALIDFGSKANIAAELAKRGCAVTIYPAGTKAETILAEKPAGIMLSNGPGDPKENGTVIETVQTLMAAQVPMFGICLGHQLMALAAGGTTTKMKFGHRGGNQPVQHLETKRVYITSQNHGYCVDDPGENAAVLFQNVNDGTCEGLRYTKAPAFSVQFHPEARGGPLDTGFLFDDFLELMKQEGEVHA